MTDLLTLPLKSLFAKDRTSVIEYSLPRMHTVLLIFAVLGPILCDIELKLGRLECGALKISDRLPIEGGFMDRSDV